MSEDTETKKKQYELEKMETGKVKMSVYMYYVRNMGLCLFGTFLTFYVMYQGFSTASSVWLSVWSDSQNKHVTKLTGNTTTTENATSGNVTETVKEDDRLFGLGKIEN